MHFEVDERLTKPVVNAKVFGPFPGTAVTRGLIRVHGNDVTIRNVRVWHFLIAVLSHPDERDVTFLLF